MQFYNQAVERFNKSTPQQKSAISVGLTLGLLILLILLVFPAVNHVLKLNREISDGKLVEQKLQDKIDALNKAKFNLESVKDRLGVVNQSLPTGSAVDDYLKELESAAKKSNLSIEGIQFTDVPLSLPDKSQGLSVRQIDYTITLKGKFSNLQQFISNIEGAIRTTDTLSISFDDEDSSVTVTIKASVSYLGKKIKVNVKTNTPNTTTNNTSTGGS